MVYSPTIQDGSYSGVVAHVDGRSRRFAHCKAAEHSVPTQEQGRHPKAFKHELLDAKRRKRFDMA